MTPKASSHSRHLRGEEGVSSILGAILLFGLLIVTLVVVQTEFVPTWEQDREARHVDVVTSQLGQVASDLSRLGGNQTTATLTDALTLERGGTFSFFGAGAGIGGTVGFTPDASSGISLSSPLMRVLARNGVPLYGLDSNWSNYAAVPSHTNVTEVSFLRLRAQNVSDPGTQAVYTATLDIRNQNQSHGTFDLIFDRESSETFVTIMVRNAMGTVLFDGGESFFHNSPIQNFYVDALDTEYLFGSLISQAPRPFDIVFTTDAPAGIFDAQFQFAGAQQSAGGTQIIGNSGVPIANFTSALQSGALLVELNNQRMPRQTYVLEHGAVILAQGGGSVMRIPPALDILSTGGQVQFTWTLPGLVGDAGGVAGPSTASLVLAPAGNRNDIIGTAATVVLAIPTTQPGAWSAWLDLELRAAGLSQALGHYTLLATNSFVTLTLNGALPGATEDIYIDLHQGNVHLSTRTTG